MRLSKVWAAAVSVSALLLLAGEARACSCIISYVQWQPCGAYARADVVFAGTVAEVGPLTAVEQGGEKLFTAGGRVTRFRVEEAFRGVAGDAVETVEEGTSCDYHFKPGGRYFVYGARSPRDGRVRVHSCSATKELERADADLAFARGAARGEPTPSLIGRVSRETRERASSYRSHLPLDGVEVNVEGEGRSYAATTDAVGTFRLLGLPPGRYTVRPKTPRSLRYLYGDGSAVVEVADGRCGGAEFFVTSLSTVSGVVVDHGGEPLKTRVELVPLDEDGREIKPAEGSVETYADERGRYKFDWVAPGRYRVAVNAKSQPGSHDPPYPRTYLPGVQDPARAAVVNVADGTSYEAAEFRLPPPLREAYVEGVVVLADGSPAAGALLTLEFTEREWMETFTADAEGRFRLKTFAGYRYLIAGEVRREVGGKWTGTHSEPAEVVAGEGVEPIRLVINRPGFYRPRFAKARD